MSGHEKIKVEDLKKALEEDKYKYNRAFVSDMIDKHPDIVKALIDAKDDEGKTLFNIPKINRVLLTCHKAIENYPYVVKTILSDPEECHYISGRIGLMNAVKRKIDEINELSDKELKEKLGIPESVDLSPEQRRTGRRMLAQYGRMPTSAELDKKFEEADRLEAMAKKARFKEIRDEYKDIRNAEKLSEKRIEIIRSNTAYVDDEMIRKDQKDTGEHIAHIKERIEENYKKVNPELAVLREEERRKVEAGMDPIQAKKEHRKAVKAHYNKNSKTEEVRR